MGITTTTPAILKTIADTLNVKETPALQEALGQDPSDEFTRTMKADPVLSKHFSSVPYNKTAESVHHYHKTAENTRVMYSHNPENPYPHRVEIQGYDFGGVGIGKNMRSAITEAKKEYNAKHQAKSSKMEAQLAAHLKTHLS